MLDIKKPQAPNPYIAGRALSQDRGFFGREDVLELVANEMLSQDRNAVVLFGQRRIGKTSILLQLQRRLPSSLFLPIYFDLMDHAAVPLGRLLFEMASVMSAAQSMPPPDRDAFDDEGLHFRLAFLPRFYERLPQDCRPVLLLDEFDVLASNDERQLSPASSSRAFFPYLRRLMESEARLGFVFVAGRKAEELSMDVKAAFKTARYKRVSVLDDASARDLILTAQKQGTLSFSPTAVDRIVKLTAGHPYFTQLVCQLIWDELQPRAANGTIPQVEVRDVDAVVAKAPEAGENICEWIWDGLPPAEKVIYAAIAHATETRPNVSAEEVTEMLQRHGVRFFTRELELAPDTLVRWEMLQEQDGRYGFFIELMRRWVAARKPLPKVKDELDRVVPLADSLYQSGDGFYRRGNLDSSQNLLQQALTVNPNHLKARLLLGQVLVEQGNLEGAVRELEEAHRHDEAAARYPLIRTLLLRQEEMERAGASDGALAACERVLELSPGNNVAMERRAAVWRARGDSALAADRLDEAAEAYEKIKASDMLDKVAARATKLKVDKLARDAQSQIGIEQWEKAASLYQQLAALDPGEKNWKAGLERCQIEFKFAKLYAEALQAVKEENWRKAQSSLIEILGSRAEYKDAPDLLVRALRPNPAPPAKHSMVGPFLTLYVKCAIALAMCAVSGLVRVQSGNGGAGSIVGFYLGTAVLLALVLGMVEMIWQALGDRREGGMDKLMIAKPVGR